MAIRLTAFMSTAVDAISASPFARVDRASRGTLLLSSIAAALDLA
jgi:hypothetical protein